MTYQFEQRFTIFICLVLPTMASHGTMQQWFLDSLQFTSNMYKQVILELFCMVFSNEIVPCSN